MWSGEQLSLPEVRFSWNWEWSQRNEQVQTKWKPDHRPSLSTYYVLGSAPGPLLFMYVFPTMSQWDSWIWWHLFFCWENLALGLYNPHAWWSRTLSLLTLKTPPLHSSFLGMTLSLNSSFCGYLPLITETWTSTQLTLILYLPSDGKLTTSQKKQPSIWRQNQPLWANFLSPLCSPKPQ